MAYGHNIFWGTRYLDHGGPFRVTCLSTGATMQGAIDHSLFRRSTKQARSRHNWSNPLQDCRSRMLASVM